MDTYRLKYFCAVVELGSLTKASEFLVISHSGLSKSLSLLQKELGTELLTPLGRGLEVTAAGKVFYQKAQKILPLIEGLKEFNTTEEQSPIVKLSLSEVLSVSCSAQITRSLGKRVSIVCTDVGETESFLLKGKVDFAIVSTIHPSPEIEYLSIGKLEFNAYARADLYSTYKNEVPYAVPFDDFPNNLMGYKLRDSWPLRLKRNSKFSVQTFSIALHLLQAGVAAVFIPSFIAKLEDEKKDKSLPKLVRVKPHKQARIEREYFLAKLKTKPKTSDMKKITKIIRGYCL